MTPPKAAPMREDVTQGEWHACPAHWGQADIVTFDDVRNSTSTMNGRIYREIVPYIDIADAKFIVAAVNAYRLAHTARPDAGERQAYTSVDGPEHRAFIDGWNARTDYSDFDLALHYWMLAGITHIGSARVADSPDAGDKPCPFPELYDQGRCCGGGCRTPAMKAYGKAMAERDERQEQGLRADAGDEVERVVRAIMPLRVDWNKFDLAEAYDLVEGVRRDAAQDPESPLDTSLRAALEAIEAADCEWDGITMP